MKRSLSIMLAVFLLLSFTFLPRTSAVENPFPLFDQAINSLRWHIPWDVKEGEAFPLVSIMSYMKRLMCTDEYGEELITENGYSYYAYYVIPADIFEATAMDCFATVDVEAMRNFTSFFWDYTNGTGIDAFQNYQPDREVYLFSSEGGMGDPSWYEVLGYTQEDGLYTVYSRFISLLWEEPAGIEGVDYIRIGQEYYAIEHYLCTVMAISNGRAQFHSWQELNALPNVELTVPTQIIVQNEQITITAATGVFPADTVVEIREPEAQMLPLIEAALKEIASDHMAFDIVSSAQPNGIAQVTFVIPDGYDAEKLALFHISQEGVAQQLEITVDADAGIITAELSHFSVYVLAQLADPKPLLGDANGDGEVNARDARLVLRYSAKLLDGDQLSLELADVNGDGKVNARDARIILRQAAGLN